MGLYDRDWTREQDEAHPQDGYQMRFGFPSMTPAVKWLLIINTGIFILEWLASGPETPGTPKVSYFEKIFALYPATTALTLQVWRLITYQFLHGDFWHIFFNMWMLFFLGPPLERFWGTRKFLFFYLMCGAAGGVFYILLVYIGFLMPLPMVGASGAILGVLTACAILFPHFVVFLLFFPVSIRAAAIILICLASVTIIFRGANAGGEAAHLAGIAAGAIYVFSDKWRTALRMRFKASRWEKHVELERKLRIELDRILKKVHDSGLHSLTTSEKKILKKATKLEQTRKKI
jgi:membrane associated rhomboid family serine protease